MPSILTCADCHEQGDCPTDHRPDGAATRAVIIELALVEAELRSLAAHDRRSALLPSTLAWRDQLQAHESHLLRALHRRRLAFHALRRDDRLVDGSRGPRWVW